MARIAGINVSDNKHTVIALQSIYGIGATRAKEICEVSKIKPSAKIKELTEEEIEALNVELDKMKERYSEADADRVANEKYIVLVGVCTHLGCVPLGQKTGDIKGQYGGWFCPCHGSHYDHSGRIRKGPAPTNLEVPSYKFLSDTLIRIG